MVKGLSCSAAWDLPRPGIEPVSPVLSGRLFTTESPRKPWYVYFLFISFDHALWLRGILVPQPENEPRQLQ